MQNWRYQYHLSQYSWPEKSLFPVSFFSYFVSVSCWNFELWVCECKLILASFNLCIFSVALAPILTNTKQIITIIPLNLLPICVSWMNLLVLIVNIFILFAWLWSFVNSTSFNLLPYKPSEINYFFSILFFNFRCPSVSTYVRAEP